MKAFHSLTRFFQSRAPVDAEVGQPAPSSQAQDAWSGICITGAHPADLASVANILFCAGMQNARAADGHNQPVDMHYWHAQVVSSHNTTDGVQRNQTSYQPGQMWERLAAEIFMANLGAPVWGWADTRSTWLLDFWKKFEPRLQFILVTSGLQSMMARLLMDDDNETDTSQFIEQWVATHQHLLQFAKDNPQRVMLVDAADVVANPEGFIKACIKKWSLPLISESLPEPGAYPQDLLATHLATQICQAYPKAVDLQRMLSTSLSYLAERSTIKALATMQGLPSAYQALRKRSQERDSLQEQLCRFEAENNAKLQKLAQENEMLSQQLKALSEQITKSKEDSSERFQELTSENELLLKQLHQVQEELESYFLKNNDLKKALEAKDKDISTLKSQATANQKALDELKKSSSDLTKARDEQVKLATDRKKQVEDLSKTTVDLTKARDDQAKLATDRKKQLDEQAGQLAQLKTELAQLQTKNKQLQDAQKESVQEGELLLKQLHQVQEELEHYFLENRNQQQFNKKLQARMDALFKKSPDLFSLDSIELLSPPAVDKQFARWRMSGLAFGSRIIPDFEFNTLIVKGVAGIVLLRTGDDSGPLLRWPSSQADSKELVLAPMGKPETLALRLAPFYELSATDWDFLRILNKAMLQALAQPQEITGVNGQDLTSLKQALEAFQLILEKLPLAVRFDQIRIKHEQVNPDYEHVWLELDNLQAGSKRLNTFEFRISCAHLQPGGEAFGAYPKLEFPAEAARQAFDNWFEDSSDDFGPKLELRLQAPATVDLSVWSRLASKDQQFIRLLVEQLPTILRVTDPGNRGTRRAWQQWLDLAIGIRQIFTNKLQQMRLAAKPVAPLANVIDMPSGVKDAQLTVPSVSVDSQTQLVATDPSQDEAINVSVGRDKPRPKVKQPAVKKPAAQRTAAKQATAKQTTAKKRVKVNSPNLR